LKVHELKYWPVFYNEVLARRKTAEYRKDDRGFMPGDFLLLQEYEPEERTEQPLKIAGHYTGRMSLVKITHVLDNQPELGLPPGYCVLSVQLQEVGYSGHLCSECHGTKYINRVVSSSDWELHPVYEVAICLNCIIIRKWHNLSSKASFLEEGR